MFTPEMLASVKKVEATRQERLGMEPRRMTAEEKDALLKAYHPDYREDGFDTIKSLVTCCTPTAVCSITRSI